MSSTSSDDEDDGDAHVSVPPSNCMSLLLAALPFRTGDKEANQGHALALSLTKGVERQQLLSLWQAENRFLADSLTEDEGVDDEETPVDDSVTSVPAELRVASSSPIADLQEGFCETSFKLKRKLQNGAVLHGHWPRWWS